MLLDKPCVDMRDVANGLSGFSPPSKGRDGAGQVTSASQDRVDRSSLHAPCCRMIAVLVSVRKFQPSNNLTV